ncbi:TPA: minor capsid protein [Streptococcus suis]
MSDKRITSNQRYNAERKAQAELMKRDLDRDKMLAQIYQESFDRMQREIDGFYMRYANRKGLTKQEAMKRVSDLDVTKFNAKAAKAVKEKDFSHATNEWLKVYNLKMKVSRLELLKAELALEIQNLTAEVNEVFDKARTDEYLNEYKRQAGILGISSSGSKKRMQAILDADFYGQKFSSRVWGGLGLRATLQREVFGSLNRIFTDMMGYKQEMKRLAKKYGTNEQNAKRLLKTEIARINADTQYSMLKDNGFTHMIFVAEPGACNLCGPLDKVAVPIEDVEKGVNMYPMHPNCRCSAYGHIKMEYKAGGSTLDREAPNGVWSEDKKTETKKSGQRQIAGDSRKLLDFNDESDKIKDEEDSFFNRHVSEETLDRVELIQRLSDEFGMSISETSRTKLPQLALEQTYSILKSFEGLYNKLPQKIPQVRALTASKSKGAIAWYSRTVTTSKPVEFGINVSYFADRVKLQDVVDYNIKKGWFSKNGDINHIMVHEFGHHVDFQLTKLSGKQFSDIIFEEMMSRYPEKYDVSSVGQVTSGYAGSFYKKTQKNTETFAELFAEAYGETPRDVANDFRNIFEEKVRGVLQNANSS